MTDSKNVTVYKHYSRIRQKLDSSISLRDYLDDATLQEAEEVITQSKGEFLRNVSDTLKDLMHACDEVRLGDSQGSEGLTRIADLAFDLKGLAGTFDFKLATAIAVSLERYALHVKEVSLADVEVMRAHVEALRAVFHDNAAGAGGETGKELVRNLQLLIKKFGKKG